MQERLSASPKTAKIYIGKESLQQEVLTETPLQELICIIEQPCFPQTSLFTFLMRFCPLCILRPLPLLSS